MLNYTNSVKDILANREFRLQQLAKTCGISMSMLAKALDARDEQAKPTTRIMLSDSEQVMLHTLCEYIGTLKESLDYQKSFNFKIAIELAEAKLEIFSMAKPVSFMEHPEFKVLSVKQALSHLWEEAVEFCQEPSKDEASDLAFGVGRLLGAIFGKKYVSFWGDGRHLAKCQERMNAYGYFRSTRHLNA